MEDMARSKKALPFGFLLLPCRSVFLMAAFLFFFGSATAMATEIYYFQGDSGEIYFTNVSGPGRVKVRPAQINKEKTIAKRNTVASAYQKDAYEPIITSTGRHFAVDPDIIRAVIKAESGYNAQAVSPKGAMGLMQLMPATAREMGVGDVFDPAQNIHGGVRYLSELLCALKGDLPLALAAYNAGPARVLGHNRIPPIQETRFYVDRVLNLYKNFKGKNSL